MGTKSSWHILISDDLSEANPSYNYAFTMYDSENFSSLLATETQADMDADRHRKELVLSFIVSFFAQLVWCQAPEPACGLNLSSNINQLNNECIDVQEDISDWRTMPKTLCCQEAIAILSRALAQKLKQTEGNNIFLTEDQWGNCRDSFGQPEQSCGLDNLLQGRSKCSLVDFVDLKSSDKYQDALTRCSSFNTDTEFDSACKNCSEAILDMRKELLNGKNMRKNATETGICGLAVLISIAAGKNGSQPWDIDGMFQCLPVLNVLATESDYIKIKYSIAKALLALLVSSVGLMLLIMLIKYVTKDKRQAKAQEIVETKWSGLYRFSKAEIENAISAANEKGSLGRGSAGQVFKGVLPSRQAVAIKHIYKSNTSDSFTREIEGLSRVRHPNLVCLFGCCVEDGDMYLVYEFCSAGNLAQNLQRKDKVLSWDTRVKILRDCALALRYLHNNIDGCIVHRDIKLTNILLTEALEPKLSDFGLAKMLGMEESKVFTDVRGTIGYMDPEYMTNAKLTSASDIYSFGIVMLQLLSGQKVIDLDLEARDQLTRKAKDVNVGKRPLKDFEDPRLKGQVITEDFQSMLQVAVLCVALSNKGRPNIDQVFQELDKAWKNTVAHMGKKDTSTVATASCSMEEMVSV